jgi:DNA-directed RNA polymerase sigma subunit (sigma70/sigma32)
MATRLRQLLEALPEVQREVILLRLIVGLSVDETAEAVGMSPSGVRLTQHRAMQRLRGSLGSNKRAGAVRPAGSRATPSSAPRANPQPCGDPTR